MIPRYSQDCIDLVKESEGLRLSCYDDAAGKQTIGYGHLCLPGESFDQLTHQQADELLQTDIGLAWEVVNDLVDVELTQGQVDALTDFVFNLGEGHFAKSALRRLVNLRDPAAADQFSHWVFAGPVKLPGLVIRRDRERALFLQADD